MGNTEKPERIETDHSILSNLDPVTGQYLLAERKEPIGAMTVEEQAESRSQRLSETLAEWFAMEAKPKEKAPRNMITSGDHDGDWRDK
jgi:hypothetical protein